VSDERAKDLRFATNEERRFALAYLRWLAGGPARRSSEPSPTHHTYALSASRGDQIRKEVEQLARDAANQLHERDQQRRS
jgi:hypothetical protein